MDELQLIEGALVKHQSYPQWGIGSVERVDHDQGVAIIRFYGRDEVIKHCALGDLIRHRYAPGDQIFAITENCFGIVQSVQEYDGEMTYQTLFGNRRKGIPESNIRPQVLEPDLFDLLCEGVSVDSHRFLLALQARHLKYAYRYDQLACLSNARIELLPHQVFVTDKVLRDYPHRFLLADEVGLGKTIEAGLILKELRARGAAQRVLIIAPAGLVSQWVDELRSKFNEIFTRIDSTNLSAHIAFCGGDVEQVWRSHNSIVTSLHMLRSNERHLEPLLTQEWDLVIFDEAHHLRRSLEGRRNAGASDLDGRKISAAYRMAQRFQKRTTSLLLLTATPLQLHAYELFSLIELLDPTLFPTFHDFDQYRTKIPQFNRAADRLDRYHELDDAERFALAKDLAALTASERSKEQPVNMYVALESPEGREQYKARLADAHYLTRVLIRNRKRIIFDDLQPRRARVRRVTYSDAEWEAYHAVTAYLQEWYNIALRDRNNALGFLMVTYRKILTSSSYALRRSFLRRIERLQAIKRAGNLVRQRTTGELPEDEAEELDLLLDRYGEAVAISDPNFIDLEINQLHALAAKLAKIALDAKASGLMTELAEILHDPNEKVLIFTQFTETLSYLHKLLDPLYQVCVFSGAMSAPDKDKAIDDFRETCQIMIATEAAGEGRNLQFCHIMVNYDLPWNPMRIEQRIGRVDRIGQKSPVQIINLSIADTLEERVLQVLHERINIFESIVGALDPILESIEQDVRDFMFDSDGDPATRMRQFEQQVSDRVHQVEQMEARLADMLLDASSFRRDRADALLGRRPAFTSDDVCRFMKQYLTFAGGVVRERAEGIFDLTIPPKMSVGMRDGLKDSYHVTFDAQIAQRQDRLDFVAFGHPVLDRVVDLCLDESFDGRIGYVTLCSTEFAPQQVIISFYEFTFEGIRPHRQIQAVATSIAGQILPDLAARALDLLAYAEPTEVTSKHHGLSDTAVDHCRSVIEAEAARARMREQQVQEGANRREYEHTVSKLQRYYAANILSRTRDMERLDRLAAEQQQSNDPKERRIAPATQGRAAAARREREALEAERNLRLGNLSRKRSVFASE
ncbi:SNF2-related protein [Candidatus Viridilinea mediisalina]|uniref:SNF2-related protein n=1 Tax=Candidatus Viridilinea mediisalina TaxID=2024553 RepID=UPI0013FDF3A7|nr:SNF2-related protein [Candidatus Viridilinea mediisalina]